MIIIEDPPRMSVGHYTRNFNVTTSFFIGPNSVEQISKMKGVTKCHSDGSYQLYIEVDNTANLNEIKAEVKKHLEDLGGL